MLGVVILTLYFARRILIPLALALTLNFLLAPAVIFLERYKFRRVPAVALVVLFAGLTVGAVGWIVAKQLLVVADGLADYRFNIHNKMAALHAPTTGPFAQAVEGLEAIGQELNLVPGSQPADASKGSTARKRSSQTRPAPTLENPMPVAVVSPPRSTLQSLRDVLVPVGRPLGEAGVVLFSPFTCWSNARISGIDCCSSPA